ncbi:MULTISPECIES: hypothetical protein [Flavobacterium]|uniref:hypothetical protein n=1 Tax=Flavobacterium TaxID=237 RepID=UPI001F16627F|nr:MULTISPECIES: hypothetical protein [Flavobacterium]
MLNKISELSGVKVLDKSKQKNILGGDPIFIPAKRCAYDNYSALIEGCAVQPPDNSTQLPTCIYICENGRWVKHPY